MIVKYKLVNKSTGFQLKYTYKGKTKTKTYNTKKSVTKTIKKLKKGKYTVKARAFIKYKGKVKYGSWCKAKKVKIK